jgi:phosphatidate cytidylyltransferase
MNKIAFGIVLGILIVVGIIYNFLNKLLLLALFLCLSELSYTVIMNNRSNGSDYINMIGFFMIIASIIIVKPTNEINKDILLILSIIVVSDIFQEFSGRLFGKNKIGWISPNKTYEGYIGGYIGMLLFYFIYNHISKTHMNFVFINIIYVAGIVGDLFFSLIKRNYNIKDYSNLLLSHGGVLDRLDSFIFAITAGSLFKVIM